MYPVRSLDMISSSRCLVHLEEISFPLYRGELSAYGIREGEALSDEAYRELLEEVLPKRACRRAMHLLQKMDRTEHQLRTKLRETGYPEDIVEQALSYVKGYHYIDDVRYAWNYIDYRKSEQSRRQLLMALREKGVSAADIQMAFEQTDFPDEQQQILYWQEKRKFDPETADLKEKRKFYQFLLRKGYAAHDIRRAIHGLDGAE